jgi:hypothetical protein
VEALAAVEQESGEGVDGHAAAEDFADDLAVALRLAVEEVSLALRLLALFGFLQAAAFLGRLHLGGIIDGSACHRTSPVAGGQNLSGGEASGEKYFANRRKIFLLLIRILLCMGRRPWNSPLPVAAAMVRLSPSCRVCAGRPQESRRNPALDPPEKRVISAGAKRRYL